MVFRENKFSVLCFALKVWNDSERREQVSIILSPVSYHMVYITHFKKSRFVEDLLFYSKNEVIASPKIEI